MSKVDYKEVEVVLAEQSGEFGDVVAPALMSRGLRDLVICRDAKALRDTMGARTVDVLLCDLELPNLQFSETIQSIRRNELGHNPFVQVIATVDELRRSPLCAPQSVPGSTT